MAADRTLAPDLAVEDGLFASGASLIAAVDEVGRGSAFGPCCVGLVVIDATVGAAPAGLRDSKLLSEAAREALIGPLRAWVRAEAVGEASAGEIDAYGLTAALRLAGHRALSRVPLRPDLVLLDGSYDWMSGEPATLLGPDYPSVPVPPVRTMVKADLRCASVAAASVLAKVHRDALIREMAPSFPGYGLEHNKGYATASHLAALRQLGASVAHRRSWRLPERDPA